MDWSNEWLRSIANYPRRFGTLSGIFYELLDEANISPERKNYFHSRIRGIDKPNASGYDGRKLTNGKQGLTNKTVGE